MKTSFGEFELDEEGRRLSLRGETLDMQPRVFDLLAYLVRNAGRVVPKDELMDALWPGLHVTEASLQRAVSLARTALKAGGLQGAIRNYMRLGYRFGIDEPGLGVASPTAGTADQNVAAARRAAETRNWAQAVRIFETCHARECLSAEDQDLWALALECLGQPADAIPVLTRAVERHFADGHAERAAISATTLSKIFLERNAMPVARGWLMRAETLLAENVDCEARSYVLWMKSRMAAFYGQPDLALTLAEEAFSIAETCEATGLKALTLAYCGFYKLSLGRTTEGFDDQDHAAAIALSGQVDPITGGLIYCNILWSCRSFADWSRASQWSAGFESWCEACFAEVSGSCQLHRAEILGIQGTLQEALSRVGAAISKLTDQEPWSLGDAYRVRGDINAMIGDSRAAFEDYARAHEIGWDSEPGNALLLFEGGDTEGALAALDRALAGTTWYHLQRRGWLLANKALIAARAGRYDIATKILDELETRNVQWPMPAIRATIAEARAELVRGADGEHDAVHLLHLARQLWTSIGSEYNAARVRLALAERIARNGDVAGARTEASAARITAQRIGSIQLDEQAETLLDKLA